MTLKVTYFSNNEVHKSIHFDVSHWYCNDGNLVIIQNGEKLIQTNVRLLNVESWVPIE